MTPLASTPRSRDWPPTPPRPALPNEELPHISPGLATRRLCPRQGGTAKCDAPRDDGHMSSSAVMVLEEEQWLLGKGMLHGEMRDEI